MHIVLNTQSLTKAHHFVLESFKLLWGNKEVFLSIVALPILFAILRGASAYFLAENVFAITFLLEVFVISILSSISWFRFLLDNNYTPTIGSYFTFDKKLFKYLLCLLTIVFTYGVLIFAITFATQYLVAPNEDGLMVAYAVGFFSMLYFLLPAMVVFPAIALNRSTNMLSFLKEAKAYRMNFLLGTVSIVLIYLGLLYLITIVPAIMGFVLIYSAQILIAAIFSYLFLGAIWTFSALYYQKYYADQDISAEENGLTC